MNCLSPWLQEFLLRVLFSFSFLSSWGTKSVCVDVNLPVAYTRCINLQDKKDLMTLSTEEMVDAFLFMQANYREVWKLFLEAELELEKLGFFDDRLTRMPA